MGRRSLINAATPPSLPKGLVCVVCVVCVLCACVHSAQVTTEEEKAMHLDLANAALYIYLALSLSP